MPCGTLTECFDVQYDDAGVAPVLFSAKVDSRIRHTSFATLGLVGIDDEIRSASHRTFRHLLVDSSHGANGLPVDGVFVAKRPGRSQVGGFLGGHTRTSFPGYGGPPGGGMQGMPPGQGMPGGGPQGMQGMPPGQGMQPGMGGGMQQPGMGGQMQPNGMQPNGMQAQQQQMNPNMQGQQQMNPNGQQMGGQGQNGQQSGNNGNNGNGNDNNNNNSSDGKGGGAAPASSNGKMAAMLGGPAGLMVAGGAVYFLFCRRTGVQTDAGGSSGSEMEDSDKQSDSGS